jgi:hypothetical protein
VKIVNRASGLVLDAHSDDVGLNGCRVQLWKYVGWATNQHWKLVPAGGGYVKIVNRASGLVLDAHSDDVHRDGCRVQLWTSVGRANQHWQIR